MVGSLSKSHIIKRKSTTSHGPHSSLRMAILPTGTRIPGYRIHMDRVWAHFYTHGLDSIYTLSVKLWVGHEYSLLSAGLPIP
jgi:hypothetical protein